MAYGFRCKHCGHQEINHGAGHKFDPRHGLIVERCCDGKTRHRGHKFSLKSCPGFTYRKEDEEELVLEYLADGFYGESPTIPERLRLRAKKIKEKEMRDFASSGYSLIMND